MTPLAWTLAAALLAAVVVTWWSSIASLLAVRRDDVLGARTLAKRALVGWLVSLLLSLVGTVVAVQLAFHAVQGDAIDAGEKARVLAQRISEAMNATTFTAMISFFPGVAALVVLLRLRRAPEG